MKVSQTFQTQRIYPDEIGDGRELPQFFHEQNSMKFYNKVYTCFIAQTARIEYFNLQFLNIQPLYNIYVLDGYAFG